MDMRLKHPNGSAARFDHRPASGRRRGMSASGKLSSIPDRPLWARGCRSGAGDPRFTAYDWF